MSDTIRIDAEKSLPGDQLVDPAEASDSGDALPDGSLDGVPGEGRLIRKRRRRKRGIGTNAALDKGRRRAIGILIGVVLFVGALGGYMYWATERLERLRAAASWDKQKIDEKLRRIEELTKNVVLRTSEIVDLVDGQAAARGTHIDEGGTLTLRVHVPVDSKSSEWDLLLQGGSDGVREVGRLQARSRADGTITMNLANLTSGHYEMQGTRSGDTRIYHYAFDIR